MSLSPGTRLGPYEIASPIGAGGMGQVYRAIDTRLDRTVAVKVLPPLLARDPEFRVRFDREARAISSLEHPHICSLYDVGRSGDTDYLVMQFVDGETLAERLARGPLPPNEALEHAIAIAAALDHAHTHGIVHRDLKPGNIMLARGGRSGSTQVKLLDFGLAKTIAGAAAPGGLDLTAPAMTRTTPLTAEGAIIGTFQYMAPEQIEGQEAGTRSDIWAFGCVLYEMLTGARAFEGRSRASLIGAIMKDEPPRISAVQPVAPAALDHVVRRCLAKSPEERWQHVRDVLAELRWIQQEGGVIGQAAPPSRRLAWLPWVAAAVLALALAAVAMTSGRFGSAEGARPVVLSLLPPADVLQIGSPALSPDGSQVVFSATNKDGVSHLWLRSIDSGVTRALPQSDDATYPFWSPDGTSIGFFAQGKLKRTSLDGAVHVIADAPHGRGAAWNTDDVIVFAPEARTGLFKVRASGGRPEKVTEVDFSKGENSHRMPVFLPDGRRFLYGVQAGPFVLAAGSLDGMPQRRIDGIRGSVLWSASGHLVFLRDASLVAQAFDPATLALSGEPIVLGDGIGGDIDSGGRSYSVSQSGAVVARAETSESEVLTWFDREGNRQESVGKALEQPGFSLSPDGTRLAVARWDERTGRSGIWLLDAARGSGPRLTAERDDARFPAWSPDGRWMAYARGNALVLRSMTDGREEELPTGPGFQRQPPAWSADSRMLVYGTNHPQTRVDIFMMTIGGERKATPVVQTAALEDRGALSPDQRWIAYCSDQTGRREVFVQRVPSDGRVWQVSTDGGDQPKWSRDGRELYYRGTRRPAIFVVPVTAAADFEPGTPAMLFQAPVRFRSFEMLPDGRRFLLSLAKDSSPGSLSVILNWRALER